MRLSTYIQRSRALGDAKVPTSTLELLGDKLAKGADLSALLKHKNNVLTSRSLLGIWRASRRHARHMAYLEQVAQRRREKGKAPIAPALLKQTMSAHEVAVLERAVEMLPPGSVAEHRRRDAIKEAIALWKSCLVLARREGTLSVTLHTADESMVERFGGVTGDTTLAEISAPDWVRVRQGIDAGAVEAILDVPEARLVAQVRARGTELHALQGSRSEEDLVRALILVDLDEWSFALKDEQGQALAIRDATTVYLDLLSLPRPTKALFAGVWIEGDSAAVAIASRDGRLVDSAVGPLGDAPIAAIEALMGEHPIEAVVLPASDDASFDALAAAFGTNFEVHRVGTGAMAEALAETKDEAPEAALKALVLAQRCARPIKFWGAVDPVALGLHDANAEIDEGMLRAALEDMRVLAQAGVKASDLARPAQAPRAPRAPAKPLNPLIKSVDDLRPGLQVNGVVTNITQFGAFVNIGLSHEGLVHVSELADHFVNDPKDVVKVGQAVQARVLGVDRARRRISLSLRPDRAPTLSREPMAEGEGPAAGGGDNRKGVRLDDIPGQRGSRRHQSFDRTKMGPGGNATGASRAHALAELEALFKKK